MHDVDNYRFICQDNKIIYLTKTENILLDLFLNNKGKVITHEEIIKVVYGCNQDRSLILCISQHICRINRKLKGEVNIRNKKGIGYILS